MHFTIIASLRSPHQLIHQAALADGCKALGIKTTLSNQCRSDTQFVACWGWRLGKILREAGHEVLVMERGYLGDRFAWSSMAWNGLNGLGQFAVSPHDNGERFKQNFEMKPWKNTGDYILVMGQVPGDASLRGQDMMPWYREACAQAGQLYSLPVMFRPHPEAIRKGHKQSIPGAMKSPGTLEQALARAALVITYNSNSAVDAVLAGVPAIASDEGSMAWNVAGHSLEERIFPDRDKWAAQLAWKQWRLNEIKSGFALSNLLSMKNG